MGLAHEMELERPNPDKKKPSAIRWMVVLVIVVLLIFACLYGVSKMTNLNILGLDKSTNGEWQAVFLSNGQVYFGKASSLNDKIVTLKNIYYLQVTQALQADGTQAATQQQGELSLVKLGNELHGPSDEMKINRDHILFIENLKNDGKVVKAIEKYMADQKAQK